MFYQKSGFFILSIFLFFGCSQNDDKGKAYVSNQKAKISVIDLNNFEVVNEIDSYGGSPRGIGVSEDGKYSATDFKLIKSNQYFSLLECCLETGRTHQIRVHTSASGFPIVGDLKYSSMTLNSDMEKRMYLHCSSLEILEKDLKITSKVPNSFFQPFEV